MFCLCVDMQQVDVEDDDDDSMDDDSGDTVLGVVTVINISDRQVLYQLCDLFSYYVVLIKYYFCSCCS